MVCDNSIKKEMRYPFESRSDLMEIVEQILDFGQDETLSKLIHNKKEEIPHDDIYEKNSDNFYVFLFNEWKKNILNISYDDLKKGKYDAGFDILPIINYLSRIPDAKNKAEVEKYISSNDAEIRLFMNKYCFHKSQNNWHVMNSRDLTIIDSNLNYDGFITLNVKRYDIPKFCKIFTKLCLERNIPFSYKYNDSGLINDNFILFFDKNYADEYFKLIREIFSKFPNLASRIGKPSALVGKTKDNIGYAVGSYEDYYSKRICHISECTSEIANNFINNCMKKKISSDLGNVSIANHLSYEIAKIIINKQCNRAIENHSYASYAKYNSTDYLKKLSVAIRKALNNKKALADNGIIAVVDNESILIKNKVIKKAYNNTAKYVYNSYPNLYDNLLAYIKISASTAGISSDYCFDTDKGSETVKHLKNKRVQ